MRVPFNSEQIVSCDLRLGGTLETSDQKAGRSELTPGMDKVCGPSELVLHSNSKASATEDVETSLPSDGKHFDR